MPFRKLVLVAFFFASLPSFALTIYWTLSGLSPAEAAVANGSRTASAQPRTPPGRARMRQATRNAQERSRIASQNSGRPASLHRLNFLFNGFIVDLTDAEAAVYAKERRSARRLQARAFAIHHERRASVDPRTGSLGVCAARVRRRSGRQDRDHRLYPRRHSSSIPGS